MQPLNHTPHKKSHSHHYQQQVQQQQLPETTKPQTSHMEPVVNPYADKTIHIPTGHSHSQGHQYLNPNSTFIEPSQASLEFITTVKHHNVLHIFE